MANFNDTTLSKAAFKLLQNKAHTGNAKEHYNEAEGSAVTLGIQEIFGEVLNFNPADAVTAGLAAAVTLNLFLDESSGGKAYFAVINSVTGTDLAGKTNPRTGSIYADGDRVGFLIPPKFDEPPPPPPGSPSAFSYRAILKNNGTEVPPSSAANWFLDYRAGMIVSENNLSLVNGTLECYVYIGKNLAEALADAGGATNHNDLLLMQGGTTGEYYHLTAAEYNNLTNLPTGQVYVGDGTGKPAPVAIFGAATLASTGELTIEAGILDNSNIDAAAGIEFSKLEALAPGQVIIGSLTSVPSATSITGHIALDPSGNTTIQSGVVGLNELANFNGRSIIAKKDSGNGPPTFISASSENSVLTFKGGEITWDFGGSIGSPEDGSYADGLFKDLAPSTPIGTAVDRFNEVLAALAPPPAPDLANIGYSSSLGSAGELSFGTSNPIVGFTNVPLKNVNDTFSALAGNSNEEKGIYGTSITTKTGTIAESVTADPGVPTPAYPAKSFGDGEKGFLQLFVDNNPLPIHQVNLATFTSGSSLNGNGSGFTNISAATNVSFPSGTTLSLFKYRTGLTPGTAINWTIAAADQVAGYNKAWVVHTNGSFTRTTNAFSWVNDTNASATTFSTEFLTSLSLTGSKYISGVQYHTGGSATYSATIDNPYRNTYMSGSSITHSASTNLTITSSSLPDLALSAGVEAGTHSFSKTATISATRILNGSITGKTSVTRTRSSLNGTSTGSSMSGLLLDTVAASSTNTNEQFNDELFRVASNLSLTNTSGYNSGGNDALWDQTQSLISGSAGHNSGLLVYNGTLRYPKNTTGTGVTNGSFNSVTLGPGGNPNYSTASGNRTYLRYFFDSSSRQNFKLNVTSSGTTFVPTTTGLSATNVHMEILAPNTTQDALSNIEFKDACVGFTNIDAKGCLNGTLTPTDWNLTLGSRGTSTSGLCIIIRITASDLWTGTIDNIQLTWL